MGEGECQIDIDRYGWAYETCQVLTAHRHTGREIQAMVHTYRKPESNAPLAFGSSKNAYSETAVVKTIASALAGSQAQTGI